MSKKLLSLALALVMCLGLTIPAFEAESKWKVEVVGKTDAEISLGKKTFTVRDWVISGTFKDDEFDMIGNIWTKTDSHQWTAENVYALSKGDEVVFTKGGESFEEFYMTAWSDPDGDGVYDQLIGNITSEDYSSTFLPANAAGPVRDFYAQTYTLFYMPSLGYLQQMGLTPDGYGSWDLTDTGGVSPVTELKMSPDFLLDIYGANTIVNIMTPDKSWNCTILVEGNPPAHRSHCGRLHRCENGRLLRRAGAVGGRKGNHRWHQRDHILAQRKLLRGADFVLPMAGQRLPQAHDSQSFLRCKERRLLRRRRRLGL